MPHCCRDGDFENNTIRVDESVDKTGVIGPCKNVAAYRTVVFADKEGQHAMRALKRRRLCSPYTTLSAQALRANIPETPALPSEVWINKPVSTAEPLTMGG